MPAGRSVRCTCGLPAPLAHIAVLHAPSSHIPPSLRPLPSCSPPDMRLRGPPVTTVAALRSGQAILGCACLYPGRACALAWLLIHVRLLSAACALGRPAEHRGHSEHAHPIGNMACAHSAARAGIIDHPDTARAVREAFLEALIWALCNRPDIPAVSARVHLRCRRGTPGRPAEQDPLVPWPRGQTGEARQRMGHQARQQTDKQVSRRRARVLTASTSGRTGGGEGIREPLLGWRGLRLNVGLAPQSPMQHGAGSLDT